jgi:integrase
MARRKRSSFGQSRRLPSGRWQARYTVPRTGERVNAPHTFDSREHADAWLKAVRTDMHRGRWTEPDATTLAAYAATWLDQRDLKPRTRVDYRILLERQILPTLGALRVSDITPVIVRDWYARTAKHAPTLRAHSYGLLRTILSTAVDDELLAANPCRIRGASSAKRAGETEPATLDELAVIVKETPARYQLMVLLAAWCALRFGELTELRGHDVDTKRGLIKVRRAVTWVDGKPIIGKPKTSAGSRDVAIPPHLLPAVREHLLAYGGGRSGLLFPSATDPARQMRQSTLQLWFYPAREAAGRKDLRFHDLRHTGAVLAAQTGATLAELMARLGHTTPAAAMRYQHAAKGRDAEIAAKLSEIAKAADR